MSNSGDKISMNASVIRRTIHVMDDILRLPDNKAAQTKVRLMKAELNDYLPETLEEYERSIVTDLSQTSKI
jgi:hypothetical protein